MEQIVDETGEAIARRVRLEREARGWSLAELAARSAVSKAAISRIERAEASPTATVLVKIATAFDLTLAGLLIRAEGAGERVSRAADQPVWRDPETGYLRKQVFLRADHPLEIAEIRLPPGAKVAMPVSSYAHIRQAVLVLSGDLVIAEGGSSHQLGPGDCLGFGPPSEVTFSNDAKLPCTYLVVLTRT